MEVAVGDAVLHYEALGAAHLPIVIFGHALGTDHRMWSPQTTEFARSFRSIFVDFRGHGATLQNSTTVNFDVLADDMAGLIRSLGTAKASYVGTSMGGVVGMKLAIRHPDLLQSLIVCCTRAKVDPAAAAYARARTDRVWRAGLASVVDTTIERWFTPELLQNDPPVVETIRAAFRSMSPAAYLGYLNALADLDFVGDLRSIDVPCLVVGGWKEPGGSAAVDLIKQSIRGSRLQMLARSAHFPNIEQPAEFNKAVMSFISAHLTGRSSDLSATGLSYDILGAARG